jgi:hypothetical protein
VLIGASALRVFGSANSELIAPGSAWAMASGHKSLVSENYGSSPNSIPWIFFGKGVTSKGAFTVDAFPPNTNT